MIQTDVLIIGGGPAGMACALAASENGASVSIVEKDDVLGGILNQCIHNGFGLHYFKEELTGPEFAHAFVKLVEEDKNITVYKNTLVTFVSERSVGVVGEIGRDIINAKAVVLAMGCRERTAGNISLCGTRPYGILTAGAVQKMVNIEGKMTGKNFVILGSGDIGLIMARRLTLEGARVHAVFEINKTSSGLRRNIMQCLEDFNIPIYYQTTITEVVGKDRVEGVHFAQVDERYNPIDGTQKYLPCDSVVLSVGLLPEMSLIDDVSKSQITKGAQVNEYFQTDKEWLFSCGNVLHVHDLVDHVALEAKAAGKFVADFVKGVLPKSEKNFDVTFSKEFLYVTPNTIGMGEGIVTAKFRLKEKIVKKSIVVSSGEEILKKQFVLAGVPGEMIVLEFDKSKAKENISFEIV